MARRTGSKLAGAGVVAGLVAFAWRRLREGGGDDPDRGREDRIVATTGQVDEAAVGGAPPPPPEAVEDPSAEGTDEGATDLLVEEQSSAAAAEAAAIGGDSPARDEGVEEDPAMRPVVEGSGDTEEALEAEDREAAGHREKRR